MRNVPTYLAVTALCLVLAQGPSASANTPSGRYTISAGTVYDSKTKLTWQQASPSGTYSWADAKAYCASSALVATLGGSGWRLPTVGELLTLVDYSLPPPSIDLIAFPNTPGSGAFWSATLRVAMTSYAWAVVFGSGGNAGSTSTNTPYYVRCVR